MAFYQLQLLDQLKIILNDDKILPRTTQLKFFDLKNKFQIQVFHLDQQNKS